MSTRTVRRAAPGGLTLSFILLAAAAGCARMGSAAMEGGATSTANGTVVTADADAAAMFTEPRIAAVSSSMNQDEIQTSRLALQRSRDAQVREFAQRMIDDHTRFEQEQQALLARRGLTPMDNALSLQMKRNLQVTLSELGARSGREFDDMYLLHQIAAHDMALKTLDTSLIPNARDAEMRAMLQQRVRPAVAEHRQLAIQVHHSMMGMR